MNHNLQHNIKFSANHITRKCALKILDYFKPNFLFMSTSN